MSYPYRVVFWNDGTITQHRYLWTACKRAWKGPGMSLIFRSRDGVSCTPQFVSTKDGPVAILKWKGTGSTEEVRL